MIPLSFYEAYKLIEARYKNPLVRSMEKIAFLEQEIGRIRELVKDLAYVPDTETQRKHNEALTVLSQLLLDT